MRFGATLLTILLFGAPILAADVDGKWVGSIAGPAGEIPVGFSFKAEGDKLSGTQTGPDGTEVPFKDGKVEGANITFTVMIDFGGMPFSINYKGVVAMEQIKLNADMFGQPFEMVLKKDTTKK
jgi:hypothetical protein